jgi:hypothetical protein
MPMMPMRGRLRSRLAAVLLALVALAVAAQQPPRASDVRSQDELDQLLAPIALYPDDLLMQVLVASTYPLE